MSSLHPGLVLKVEENRDWDETFQVRMKSAPSEAFSEDSALVGSLSQYRIAVPVCFVSGSAKFNAGLERKGVLGRAEFAGSWNLVCENIGRWGA